MLDQHFKVVAAASSTLHMMYASAATSSKLTSAAPAWGCLAGCHTTSILSWVRMGGAAHGTTPTQSAMLSADVRHELIELHRKLGQVQMERDILAKATAWFASSGDKSFTHLCADCRQSGRTTGAGHVQNPPSLGQRFLKLAQSPHVPASKGQHHVASADP